MTMIHHTTSQRVLSYRAQYHMSSYRPVDRPQEGAEAVSWYYTKGEGFEGQLRHEVRQKEESRTYHPAGIFVEHTHTHTALQSSVH